MMRSWRVFFGRLAQLVEPFPFPADFGLESLFLWTNPEKAWVAKIHGFGISPTAYVWPVDRPSAQLQVLGHPAVSQKRHLQSHG